MTETPVITPALDGELAERVATYKRTFEADVAAVKRALAQWLDAHPSNSTATPIALLETAFDRYLAERTSAESDLASAAADATDLVQAVLRRVVQKRREILQRIIPAITRAKAVPADDEECAKRLTEIVKLLDTLTDRVPDHLVSREELTSATETLDLLLGWFAGGIDQPARLPETSLHDR
jgi:iron-sulfur cluster repair protein YtfE (RIC family)